MSDRVNQPSGRLILKSRLEVRGIALLLASLIGMLALTGCGGGAVDGAQLGANQGVAVVISGDHYVAGDSGRSGSLRSALPAPGEPARFDIHVFKVGSAQVDFHSYHGAGVYSIPSDVEVSGVFQETRQIYRFQGDQGTVTVQEDGKRMRMEAESLITIPSVDPNGKQQERASGRAHVSAVWLCA